MLGPQCTENPPTLGSSNTDQDNIQEIGGLKTYVSGDEDSKLAILMIADAFGFEAPNLRKLADKVAALGYLVVVPDFFYGDPYNPEKPGFDRESWIKAHSPARFFLFSCDVIADKGCEDAKTVIEVLKSKGVNKVGAVGFCWGGMVVVRLANYDCIQAGVSLHPGPITEEEINEVKIPLAILGAEIDSFSPPEHLKRLGEILSSKGEVDCFVKRYSADDEFAVNSAEEEAQSDMINWLNKYILG